MWRWVGRIVGLVVLIGLILVPALVSGSGSADQPADSATIKDYRANFVVDRNGDLHGTEKLLVDLPFGKHGIFRFFDQVDPTDSHVRLAPEDIKVTRDGSPEPFELLSEGGGRYTNVKIGSANRTLDGEHTYVISYTVPGALSPGTDGKRTQFYWNIVPGGWRMSIDRTELRVQLPAAAEDVKCAVGAGSSTGCRAVGGGTSTLRVQTGALPPNTPVTLKTALDLATPARVTRPWPWQLAPALGNSYVPLVLSVLLALAAAVAGDRLGRPTREKTPQFPLMYAPPEGIGPAQGAYVLEERTSNQTFVATIMQASELGATTLTHEGGWTITTTGDQDAWGRLDPVTGKVISSLGLEHGPFAAVRGDVSSGKRLKSALEHLTASVPAWARTQGLMTTAGWGQFARVLVVGAIALTLFLCLLNPFNLSVLALVPGAFALFGLEVLLPGAATRRTDTGRELWSRVGGFKRILATPSAEARFDFSGRQDLYTAFLPWAVALGCADAWAQKYRVEMGSEPPVPTYLGGYGYGMGAGSMISSMTADFQSTVDSAVSAYQATQASSSGGGGGFSGGGGGGGGGGGSW